MELLAALVAVLQEGTLTTAENATVAACALCIRTEGADLIVEYTDLAGARRTLKADEVVEMVFGDRRAPPEIPPAREDLEVTLTNGDRLVGRAGETVPDALQLVNKAYGNPVVKLEQIRSVVLPVHRACLPRPLPVPAEADVVLKKTGDCGEGTLRTLSREGARYRSTGLDKELTVALDDLAGVWMAPTAPPPGEPSGLLALVYTREGSSRRGRLRALDADGLALTDFYGTAYRIAVGEVACLYVQNGRGVHVSDLDPIQVEEEANFIRSLEPTPSDLEYPFQRDRSARSTRLILGGLEYRRGVGVRAHSKLTYALAGAYRRFQAVVGLDDISRGLGAVRAEVWVDDRKAWEGTFKGHQAPQSVDADVADGRELSLVVTWAGDGRSDFVDWALARLVR